MIGQGISGIYLAWAKCASSLAICRAILNKKISSHILHDLEYSANVYGGEKNLSFLSLKSNDFIYHVFFLYGCNVYTEICCVSQGNIAL